MFPLLIILGVGALLLLREEPKQPAPGDRIDLKKLCPGVKLPPFIDLIQSELNKQIALSKSGENPMSVPEILRAGANELDQYMPGEYTDLTNCVRKLAADMETAEAGKKS